MSIVRRQSGTLLVVFVLASFGSADLALARPCWQPPVDARVTDPYREPTCRWCPGNRGIEYGTPAGAQVRSVTTGRVTFAGTVAGTVYVVVGDRDGRRITYANLVATTFTAGDLVVRGQTVGTTAGRLHFGVRVGDRYVDPTPFLGRWVYRVRLLPSGGGAGNPPPPARLTCGSARSD